MACAAEKGPVMINQTSKSVISLVGISLSAALAACSSPSDVQAANGQSDMASAATTPPRDADLVITNFVGIIERTQTADGPVQVRINGGAPALLPTIRTGPSDTGTQVVVSGEARTRRTSCNSTNGVLQMEINGTRYSQAELPVLQISAPASVRVQTSNALVGGDFGALGTSKLGLVGCQDLAIGTVTGDLDLSLAGSGDVRTGAISGNGNVNLTGSSELSLGTVSGNLNLNVAGSGDTQIASVGRDIGINIAGSGDVSVGAGRNNVDVNIAGSGNVSLAGTAIEPSVSIVGSGDVSVATLEGRPNVSRIGSGQLRVGR
jgi:Putative auto-transporter adhesin, head GIN domain